MIVGPGQRHDRIDEASFLQAKEDGIGAEFRAKAAVAEFVIGLAGIFFAIGITQFGFFLTAALKNAKNVSWLRNFPTEKRIKLGEHAFGANLLRRRRRKRFDRLRLAVAIVAFAETSILRGVATVVVERRAPQKPGMSHHARRGCANFLGVAAGGTTSFRSNSQVSGIHKLDEFGRFFEPFRERAFRQT